MNIDIIIVSKRLCLSDLRCSYLWRWFRSNTYPQTSMFSVVFESAVSHMKVSRTVLKGNIMISCDCLCVWVNISIRCGCHCTLLINAGIQFCWKSGVCYHPLHPTTRAVSEITAGSNLYQTYRCTVGSRHFVSVHIPVYFFKLSLFKLGIF